MLDSVYLLGMCAWLWISFALLALSQERHRERVLVCDAPFALSGWAQRTLALIAIAATLPLCIALDGAAFGSLLWALLLSACAACVALTLTVCPRLLRPLAWLLGR
jgi:hypothetical protein